MNALCRRIEGGRLAYYKSEANSAFWDSIWDTVLVDGFFDPYLRGDLGFFRKPFERYLPKEGKILEAGCGTGQYVVALRSRGYDCIGIDYAADTVQRVKSVMPELPIMIGDITAMDVSSAAFSAVISLGVVEHRREGPEPFLREMRRVLDDDGRLLVSVPHFNLARRARARVGAYQEDCTGMSFYQWAFTPEEFREILSSEGLEVVEEYDYNYFKCLLDEFGWLDRLPTIVRNGILKGSGFVPGVQSKLGHMRLFVAKKS